MLLLGSMRSMRSSSMRYTEPHGHTEETPVPLLRSTCSSAPLPYEPKRSKYGFMIKMKEEEDKLGYLEGDLWRTSTLMMVPSNYWAFIRTYIKY
jgi:hypothetical protein